jgi:chitodextrinase
MRSTLVSWAGAAIFLSLFSGCSGNDSADTVAPTAPANVLAAAVSPNEIVLSWGEANDNVGVATYEIYAWDVPVVSIPSTTTMFSYTGLAPSTQYCCTVRAIDAAGNESVPSDPPACATTPPAAPSGLRGSGSQIKIGLNWTASAGAAAYNVYRDGVLTGTVQITFFLDSGLNTSTQYCYTVSAVDAAGNESPASAPACITTLPPLTDTTIPAVVSTTPPNNASDVQTDPLTLSAVFSEAMSPLSMATPANFSLGSSSGHVTIDLVYDAASFKVTFIPWAALTPGTTYTATISGNVEDVAMNPMGVDYVWSFTTTTNPVVTLPSVVSTSPTTSATNVPVSTVITAVFSEEMNSLTLTRETSNFIISGVYGLVTYAPETATFTPNSPLAPNTTYTCTISGNVTDLSGHKMAADYTWSFTTAGP